MKFREHRGSLDESMKTVREINSLFDIEKLFPSEGEIKITKYCQDDRINWDTYIVTGKSGVIGFTNGNLKKSIEEQIFELIKKGNFKIFIFLNYSDFNGFKSIFENSKLTSTQEDYWCKEYKQCLFLAIMKGVHQLIEGDRKFIIGIFNYSIYLENEINEYLINKNTYKRNLASYFYFSSNTSAEKAMNILSNFFGINILDWWYK